jgi:hypothetical protein
VGGVALLVLFFVLLYCIRKQGRPLTPQELERKKKLKEKDIISPFIIPQTTSEPLSNGPTAGSPTAASGAVNGHQPSDARAEKARLAMLANNTNRNFFTPGAIERLPTELTANSTFGDTSLLSASSVSTNDTSHPLVGAHRRKVSKGKIAEELRRERERLDKQIAELERRTSVGGSRAVSRRPNTDNDEMLAELAALREQMSLVQAAVPNEPPPDYYPASITGHSSRH